MDESWEHPRWGINFEWLAVDPTGCVALFDTAGHGAVPLAVFERVAQVDEAAALVDELPILDDTALKVVNDDGERTFWSTYLDRGLYVYDWEIWRGPYRRLRPPVRAVSVDDLPPSISSVAQLVMMSVPFSSTTTFTTAMLP